MTKALDSLVEQIERLHERPPVVAVHVSLWGQILDDLRPHLKAGMGVSYVPLWQNRTRILCDPAQIEAWVPYWRLEDCLWAKT